VNVTGTSTRWFWLDEVQYDPSGLVQDEVMIVRYDDGSGGWEPYYQDTFVVGRSTNIGGNTATLRFFGEHSLLPRRRF
jgi:hypothetical protein